MRLTVCVTAVLGVMATAAIGFSPAGGTQDHRVEARDIGHIGHIFPAAEAFPTQPTMPQASTQEKVVPRSVDDMISEARHPKDLRVKRRALFKHPIRAPARLFGASRHAADAKKTVLEGATSKVQFARRLPWPPKLPKKLKMPWVQLGRSSSVKDYVPFTLPRTNSRGLLNQKGSPETAPMVERSLRIMRRGGS